jgi:hypothetical protein
MTRHLPIRTVRYVDRTSAVRELPGMHAVAIRLHDRGFDDHAIAVALEIDDEQVLGVLGIAEAKLANLMAGSLGHDR